MPQHVRMDREGELGCLANPGEKLAEAGRGHRPAALGSDNVWRGRYLLTLQLAQGAQL
jgi:hypothetical protein